MAHNQPSAPLTARSLRLKEVDEQRNQMIRQMCQTMMLSTSDEHLHQLDALDLGGADTFYSMVRIKPTHRAALHSGALEVDIHSIPSQLISSMNARIRALEVQVETLQHQQQKHSRKTPAWAKSSGSKRATGHFATSSSPEDKDSSSSSLSPPVAQAVQLPPLVQLLEATPLAQLDPRSRVLSELLATEAIYINTLSKIMQIFSPHLSATLTPEELEAALQCKRLNAMIIHHSAWYKALQANVEQWDTNTSCIGDILVALFAELPRLYVDYVSDFTQASALIRDWSSGGKKREALAQLREHEQIGTNGLIDHLICPVQRVPRYPMLLRELEEATPSDHRDYEMIERSRVASKHAADQLNELAENVATFRQVQQLCASFTGERGRWLCAYLTQETQRSSNRRIRANERVKVFNGGQVSDRMQMIIFDDLLLFCQSSKKKSRLEVMEHMWLRQAAPVSLLTHNGELCLLLETEVKPQAPPKPKFVPPIAGKSSNTGNNNSSSSSSRKSGASSGVPGIRASRSTDRSYLFALLEKSADSEDSCEAMRMLINNCIAVAAEFDLAANEPHFLPWAGRGSEQHHLPKRRSLLVSPKKSPLFGVSIALAVPDFITECLKELHDRGPSEADVIFQQPGSAREVSHLRLAYEYGKSGLLQTANIHSVATLFLTFLRSLPEAVLPPSVCMDVLTGDGSLISELHSNRLVIGCLTCWALNAISKAQGGAAFDLASYVVADLVHCEGEAHELVEAVAELIKQYPRFWPASVVDRVPALTARTHGQREEAQQRRTGKKRSNFRFSKRDSSSKMAVRPPDLSTEGEPIGVVMVVKSRDALQEGDLALVKGELIDVIQIHPSGFWAGRRQQDGTRGLFESSFTAPPPPTITPRRGNPSVMVVDDEEEH